MVMLTQTVVVVKLMVMIRRTFITEWSIKVGDGENGGGGDGHGVDDSDDLIAPVHNVHFG